MRTRTKYLITFLVFFFSHLLFAIYFCYISDHWGAGFTVMIADFPVTYLAVDHEIFFLDEKELLVLLGSLYYGLIGMILLKIFRMVKKVVKSPLGNIETKRGMSFKD